MIEQGKLDRKSILREIEKLKEMKAKIHGSKCEVYSRVVGYLRPVEQWNDGKQQEFRERKTFRLQ